ncbi:MAG TPA: hypothetical protein VN380_08815 [Thermoanaerobaculia bacterium]|nr:hypothetical protein [Thermoanaerobaculia bacterium]
MATRSPFMASWSPFMASQSPFMASWSPFMATRSPLMASWSPVMDSRSPPTYKSWPSPFLPWPALVSRLRHISRNASDAARGTYNCGNVGSTLLSMITARAAGLPIDELMRREAMVGGGRMIKFHTWQWRRVPAVQLPPAE